MSAREWDGTAGHARVLNAERSQAARLEDYARQIIALQAQRDRMLAALQIILACLPDDSGGVTLGSWELGKVLDAVQS